jgi:hypothetical protein
MKQLQTLLTEDDVKFDVYTNEVHYNNGYYNLSRKNFVKEN